MLAIPLRNRTGEVEGVLTLLHGSVRVEDVRPQVVAFIEKLSGVAAIAIETRRLMAERKALLEAFIELVAAAIDAKSPYTGGHCQRVPVLTKMLARAACDARDGPFRDFALSEDEWEAVHIASWLHDCGKVTTPEYVVDKATKLETLCDRIHEVRMRFEVLKRDAEIAYWKERAAGGDEAALASRLQAELKRLDDDFAFIATCNEGGEAMASDSVDRLRRIAQRTWQRTLDDRVGISWEERQRKERTPAAALPATERLLADKPEHVIERGPADTIPPGNPFGFKLTMPPHRYDRGEIHNLTVGRGTLTDEERYKINEHIVQTIIMLEKLPFPRHLRSVPEIAGGHHEKMDGGGYPRGLTKEQMSPVARMLVIADIFEALTAADRPYKKGKTLSEAIGIMGRMCRDRHIDAQLFELFLVSGVYQEYAKNYLTPEQIDEVDIRLTLHCRRSRRGRTVKEQRETQVSSVTSFLRQSPIAPCLKPQEGGNGRNLGFLLFVYRRRTIVSPGRETSVLPVRSPHERFQARSQRSPLLLIELRRADVHRFLPLSPAPHADLKSFSFRNAVKKISRFIDRHRIDD